MQHNCVLTIMRALRTQPGPRATVINWEGTVQMLCLTWLQ